MHTLLHTVAPTLQQATADPRLHQQLLDIHGQVWASLLEGHCTFLLGPGAHKVLFVSPKSLFPQSNISSFSSVVGLMVTSSKSFTVSSLTFRSLIHFEFISELCLSVSCGGMGQQWTAAGAGALGVVDLGMT